MDVGNAVNAVVIGQAMQPVHPLAGMAGFTTLDHPVTAADLMARGPAVIDGHGSGRAIKSMPGVAGGTQRMEIEARACNCHDMTVVAGLFRFMTAGKIAMDIRRISRAQTVHTVLIFGKMAGLAVLGVSIAALGGMSEFTAVVYDVRAGRDVRRMRGMTGGAGRMQINPVINRVGHMAVGAVALRNPGI